jgi:hypothetical protein
LRSRIRGAELAAKHSHEFSSGFLRGHLVGDISRKYGPPRYRKRKVSDGLVCANVFVNKGEDVVKDKEILPVAWSNARSQSLETRVRADPSVESFWVERSPSTINSVTTATMIPYSDTQSILGARAPTQPVGLACTDQNTFQATLDERTCGYGVCVRSIQYIRIASLRAVATLATVKCF